MQENEDERQGKHPNEMTTDELLDYSLAPEVAEALKARIRDDNPPDDRDERND